MILDELISVMVDSEDIIIMKSISKIEYFKGSVKAIPEELRDKEIVYLSHTKENIYVSVI